MCGKETLSLITSPSTNYDENIHFNSPNLLLLFGFCTAFWAPELN